MSRTGHSHKCRAGYSSAHHIGVGVKQRVCVVCLRLFKSSKTNERLPSMSSFLAAREITSLENTRVCRHVLPISSRFLLADNTSIGHTRLSPLGVSPSSVYLYLKLRNLSTQNTSTSLKRCLSLFRPGWMPTNNAKKADIRCYLDKLSPVHARNWLVLWCLVGG